MVISSDLDEDLSDTSPVIPASPIVTPVRSTSPDNHPQQSTFYKDLRKQMRQLEQQLKKEPYS